MPFYQVGAIKYYRFTSFENEGVYHAVFTRRGGFSPTPWHSLNFGASVGDDSGRVAHNRQFALESVQLKPDSVYDLHQVHSSTIVTINRSLLPGEPHQKADAILTRQPGITLMMRFADCVPILLYDPHIRAIGIAHAGWIGTVDQIAKKTVQRMQQEFGSNPRDILAAIGPSIGPDHYSIGPDVVARVQGSFGNQVDMLVTTRQGKPYFNLWQANRLVLEQAGVEQVEVCELCTSCSLGDWYSHRGEHGKTGRFGVVFGLSQ